MRRAGWRALLAAVALCVAFAPACASTSTEKGGLVPLEVAPDALEAARAPRRIALLVGIGTFDDPAWRKLRYAEKDAADLARVLADPQRGAFSDVETIGAASRSALQQALRRVAALDGDEQDTVVLYISSHGTLAHDARGQLRRYVVTRDTRMADIPGTALSLDEIRASFDTLRSRRKVLILAACHSGGGKSSLPPDVARELEGVKAGFLVRPIEEVSRATVVLAAADWGEAAREDEALENDIYTHYLVEALSLGVDRNGDGAVTVSEAHDYARRLTYGFTGGRQRPTAETSEVGADPIVLVGRVRHKGHPELYSYAPALDGFTVSIDGRPLAELPGGVAIPAGQHRLQLAKGGGPAIVDSPITVAPGDRVDVETLLARAVHRWEVAPRFAALGFLDARSRREIMGPIFGVGATLTLREWPARRMALRFDLVGSAGGTEALGTPATYSAFTAGVALPWRFSVFAPGAALTIGPRLSAVYLERRFNLQLAGAPQSYFVMTPGLLLGASYDIGDRFTLGLELQLDWALLRVDGASRSTAFGEILMGVGYRF